MIQCEIELYEQTKQRLGILQKISTNTKIQIRFIHERKLKGLLRLLEERAQYFEELTALNAKDLTKNSTVQQERVTKMLLLIDAKQQEIIKDNRDALEAAVAEKNLIMADLCQLRSRKQMRNTYDTSLAEFTGIQINQNG